MYLYTAWVDFEFQASLCHRAQLCPETGNQKQPLNKNSPVQNYERPDPLS